VQLREPRAWQVVVYPGAFQMPGHNYCSSKFLHHRLSRRIRSKASRRRV